MEDIYIRESAAAAVVAAAPSFTQPTKGLAHDSLYPVNKTTMMAYPCEYVYSSNLLIKLTMHVGFVPMTRYILYQKVGALSASHSAALLLLLVADLVTLFIVAVVPLAGSSHTNISQP